MYYFIGDIFMNEENLIKYYNKFNEDKRLNTRHGQVEFITSMTDSAWDKSILPFKNALLVNSPGSAGLAPFLITASSTLFITYTPPWQSISTVSSLVYVFGAFIKSTITSSIFSSPSYIKP